MPPAAGPDSGDLDHHLSQISTVWTALFQAHAGTGGATGAAQRKLLERYQHAVYRYLLAALRDRDAADEAFQEFALRLVRGDFKRASPERGRFRDFLKTCLYHLIVDHHRRRQRRPQALDADTPEPAVEEVLTLDADRQFLTVWKAELMDRAWAALATLECTTGQPLHAVLRYRTEHPDIRSPQMAEHFSARLGKPVTSEWVRKRLFLAREKYTDFLLDEVARSLEEPTTEALVQELIDLELLDYCKAALQRRQSRT